MIADVSFRRDLGAFVFRIVFFFFGFGTDFLGGPGTVRRYRFEWLVFSESLKAMTSFWD